MEKDVSAKEAQEGPVSCIRTPFARRRKLTKRSR